MSNQTAKWGFEDSLTSKKNRKIDRNLLSKEIQHKLKLIEKAFS